MPNYEKGVYDMAKEKATLYEEMEFDNVQYAVDVVNAHKVMYNKAKKGLHLSIFATLYTIFGFPIIGSLLSSILGNLGFEIALISALCFSLASYIIGGGLGTAIKWAFKLGAFGWIILPFPWDLITGFLLMGCSAMFFFFVPVIFVYMNYRQINMDYKAAKKYISYYKVKQTQEQQVQQRTANRQSSYQSDYGRTQPTQTRNAGYQTQGRTYSDRGTNYSSRTATSSRTSNQSYQGRGRSY